MEASSLLEGHRNSLLYALLGDQDLLSVVLCHLAPHELGFAGAAAF